MRVKKSIYKIYRGLFTLVLIAVVMIFALIGYFSYKIPSSFYVIKGNEFELRNLKYINLGQAVRYDKTSLANRNSGDSQTVEIMLFGIVPIKSAHVSVISKQEITPGGTAFGIKLFTKGVMVIDINNVETASAVECPAKTAGIKKGDMILSIDGQYVHTNEEIAAIINSKSGKPLNVVISRDGVQQNCILTPSLSKIDNCYKGGIWVRDSSAGIGTVTYYNKATGVFAGLGHGICDSDTAKIMPLATGEVCAVHINGIVKGEAGAPGELKGMFASQKAEGELMINNEAGIYGVLYENPNKFESVEIMLKQELKVGPAEIICTLDGSGPQKYGITIDKIDLNPRTLTKNMTITVTDSRLLEKTGGIVQGMSGSPILQDGKLAGAVTHVFVNNPTRGYGIFIENMLKYSDLVTEEVA